MHVVTAIPIGRGIGADSLSYFSKDPMPVGTVIRVPVRSRNMPALVLSSVSVSEEKLGVKGAGFALKKIPPQTPHRIFTGAFMDAVAISADFHACTTGAMMSALVPQAILEKPPTYAIPDTVRRNFLFEESVVQAPHDERISYYRSSIRESLARGESVLVVVPTIWHAVSLGALFARGIEHRTSVLHGGMTPKTVREEWEHIATSPEPVLVVLTGGFLSVPRSDIGTIIIENEASEHYARRERPFVDIRGATRECARAYGARLINGDTIVSAETYALLKQGDATPAVRPVLHLLSPATTRIVDMRTHDDEKGFSLLSDEVLAMAEHLANDNSTLFVLVGQRGLASTVLCRECGSVITCATCGDPLTIHEKTETVNRHMACHRCGTREAAPQKCAHCGSWNLGMFGVTTDGVVEMLNRELPATPLFRLESDHVKTHREAASVVREWTKTPGGILVGTAMALPYLPQEIPHVAVASIDALFGVPDFRIHEKIMGMLTELRLRAKGFFIIQTRAPELSLVQYAAEGNAEGFYTDELITRKDLEYPPYVVHILLGARGTANAEQGVRAQVEETFADWNPKIFSARGSGGFRALITLPAHEWPHPELLAHLRALPPIVSIAVNPRSVV